MDNHPIPQDVTGFQFKLIGSMTIKQFGYVGAGVVLAVVFYYAPIAWYIKFFLIPFLTITGISLAFLPIEGRPMDLMLQYFVTAVVRPNQYVYQKVGGILSFSELNLQAVVPQTTTSTGVAAKNQPQNRKKEEQLLTYLYNTSGDAENPLDQRENQLVASLFSQSVPTQGPQPAVYNRQMSGQTGQQAGAPPAVNAQTATPQFSAAQYTQPIQNEPVKTPVLPVQTVHTPSPQPVPPTPLAKEPREESTSDKDTTPAATPSLTVQPVPPPTFVQVVPPNPDPQKTPAQASGMDFPNLVTGIVKDSRGNVLPGILVEVKNKDGESVRAFKTNALGQFASATQLPHGTYTITFEDPKGQHKFNNVQVEINGSVLVPLIVISVDAREELRRSLFG